LLARKSIKQRLVNPSPEVLSLMDDFRQMTNDCIRIGLEYEALNGGRTPSLKRLSLIAYHELRRRYGGYSGYTLCAISKATGILSARRKSLNRGFQMKKPYLSKDVLVSCYGFKIDIEKGTLTIHLNAQTRETIHLNPHTRTAILSEASVKVKSFTMTPESLSLCISKEVKEMEAKLLSGTIGVDRNLQNLAVGNNEFVTFYDIAKVTEIAKNTRSIVGSFKRNDSRIREKIASKYGKRRKGRVNQILNMVSKKIVLEAKEKRQAIFFENMREIRKLFRKGNSQTKSFRNKMNSVPWYEFERQTQHKAAWEGVPTFMLTKGETRGTTMDCPRCGERLQVASRFDEEHYRQLWCPKCKRWMDRDVVAVMNISQRGRLRFDRSQGEASEAVKGNPQKLGRSQEPVILRVDASKLGSKDMQQCMSIELTGTCPSIRLGAS
jgi:putative transposase